MGAWNVGVRGPAAMPTLSRRSKILIGVSVFVLFLLLVGPRFVSLYTDLLWFDDIGYSSVFSTIIWTRVVLFLIGAVIAGGIVFGGLALAYRARPVFVPTSGPGDPIARYRTVVMSRIRWFSLVPALLVGIIAGLVVQGSWSTVQVFLHSQPFGVTDPQFNLDVGFYAFDLAFYRLVLNFLFVVVVIAFLANLVTHYIFGGIHLAGRNGALTRAARIQLAVIAGTFLLLKAVAYWFDRYTLLSSTRKQDVFTGASYTDINAVLPSKLILLAIAAICGLAFFAGIVLRDLRIPAMATALMVLSAMVVGVGWPLVLEQFSVKPNAAQKEAKFIQRNIRATEAAYNIGSNQVSYQRNWTSGPVDQASVDNDSATLSNIRLLDPNVISPAFTQKQQGPNFYGFPTQLAIDRYKVDGVLRDYVVAVRELDPTRFAANQQNWLNKHTVYTHGNGFIAAPANQVDVTDESGSSSGGQPVFVVSDISSIQAPGYANSPIKVKQPRIYFGELIAKVNPDYAIVGSDKGEKKEYDTENAPNYAYTGGAGVSLGNVFNRLAYSIKYTERNILLSGAINSKSKIIYNRDPRDRVKKAAPWLTVDSKTYPAVMADGSIKWIVDGYTTLDAYPYAQKTSLQDATIDAQELNQGQTGRTQVNKQIAYVRNSVKATVDAYTGKVTLYQFDDKDPVLKTWMKVFPGSVKPRSELLKNQSLVDHVRYPEDLFKIQRALLEKYHVKDPQTFFQGNDFWSVPNDPTNRDAVTQSLDQPPYYFVARDPSGQGASFQLTTVMNTLRRPFLAAYMTVSSNPNNYGRITVREVGGGPQRDGPTQVFSNMERDSRLAADRKSLENNANVQFGNLLTLPVGTNGILNVVPVYTQAKNNDASFPQLFKVIVQYQRAGVAVIGYASTVAGALQQVGIDPASATAPIGGNATPPADTGGSTGQGGTTPPTGAGTTPPTTTAPPSSTTAPPSTGGADPARDAAVKELNDSLTALQQAQNSGNFTAYGQALDRLRAAVQKYEALPK
ncbi:UPF0182 family protein [Williamsia sp. CHRR-6]|uniref:UPF0182 family protein n=1 Tax=Williamsia sp. CHRR-6 TaxID=2835871 RepID=UPI001BDB6672|nr:UPF0182 family protein [Williamsia sp. CHRR-6]MBT0565620.1 UPF0182 family protein [Williamsia sp. CHRR-6]